MSHKEMNLGETNHRETTHSLPCEIICDLLPSYIDGLTNSVTDEAIETHVETCKACRKTLNLMRTPEATQPLSDKKEEIQIIQFLKKAHKKHRLIIIGAISASIFIIFLVLFLKFYLLGSTHINSSVACNVEVSGQTITADCSLTDSSLGISSVTFTEENGIVTLGFRTVLASPLHTGDRHLTYTAKNNIKQIRTDSRILWDNGERISPKVSDAYISKHPYIGDVSANGRTAGALGIAEHIGTCTSELQTTSEPYAWKLILSEDVPQSIQPSIEESMRSYACVLLALIDNLGEVTYDYTVDGTSASLTVTCEDASALTAQNIKDAANTPAALQHLMRQTGTL